MDKGAFRSSRIRPKKYSREKALFATFFVLVFALPLFTMPWSGEYFLAFTVSSLVIIGTLFLTPVHNAASVTGELPLSRLIGFGFVVGASLFLINLIGLDAGIQDRESVRGITENTNTRADLAVTIALNANFLGSALIACLLQFALSKRSFVLAAVALVFASTQLAFFGTRFLFLLSVSPIFYSVFFSRSVLTKLVLALSAIAFSSYIAIARATGNLNLSALLYYDVPSTASYFAVVENQPRFENFTNFFYGNFLVLIPRYLFPDKPVDPTVIDFTAQTLGAAAVERGASYLPGFIGSSWLYGGYFSVVILSALLAFLFAFSIPRSADSILMRTARILVLVGVVLQFRNVSVMYFLPAFFVLIALLAREVAGPSNRTRQDRSRLRATRHRYSDKLP